jgi:ABC-type phosphate/phosphonate transport system substrate-binding protein
MFGRIFQALGAAALGACIVSPSISSRGGEPARTIEPVRIGMISSLFRDVPQATVLAMMQPLGAIMETQTGVRGELVPAGDADNLGQQLFDGTVQLGVFHGIEFAWARQKHPELRPLCIAINQTRYLNAYVVVRSESKVTCLGDLRDKIIALPCQSREHCHLFLHRHCPDCKPHCYFAKVTNPANAEEALDDAIDGVVEATVVDSVTLDCFKRRKPGRAAKLRIVQTSEVFPAAVVAYKPGVLDEATLKRFRDGMMNANRTIIGKQMLTLWKLTGFEEVPQDYDRSLLEIVKAYPPPPKP